MRGKTTAADRNSALTSADTAALKVNTAAALVEQTELNEPSSLGLVLQSPPVRAALRASMKLSEPVADNRAGPAQQSKEERQPEASSEEKSDDARDGGGSDTCG